MSCCIKGRDRKSFPHTLRCNFYWANIQHVNLTAVYDHSIVWWKMVVHVDTVDLVCGPLFTFFRAGWNSGTVFALTLCRQSNISLIQLLQEGLHFTSCLSWKKCKTNWDRAFVFSIKLSCDPSKHPKKLLLYALVHLVGWLVSGKCMIMWKFGIKHRFCCTAKACSPVKVLWISKEILSAVCS